MRRVLLLLFTAILALATACNSGTKKSEKAEPEKSATIEETVPDNTLSEAEKQAGWVLLFDGKTIEGWRGNNKDHAPTAWQIVDGALMCKGSGEGEAGAEHGGDILYDEKFKDFQFKLDWKISEGGNSGIFYLGEEVEGWPIFKTAPEMQILDNERHPDAILGKDGNRMAGSLYDLIPAKPQNTNPAGEWNSVEIICYQGTVVHKQNGEVVVEYHLWTDDWKALVADSKFPKLNPDWADVAKEGYIALQDHGNDVWFKNIKIKKL